LAAFIDRNKDGNHQWSEQAAIYSLNNGKPSPVLVTAGRTITLNTISIKEKLKKSDSDYQSKVKLSWGLQNIGRITTLDNDMFAPENYSTGLWRPFHFLEHVGGGLFFLQPYDASKVPVLFIHGINGGPKDWEHAISLLDEQYFQAWILYYPTGFRLDMISDYLLKAIPRLQDQLAFKKIIIAAHSMGGLVARSFIKKYTQNHPDLAQSLCLLITVNSPLGGMESAALGVQTLPIVLPVWRDLDPDSPFLAKLNKWVWPNNIPYHLFFSYIAGESGDNVVQLKTQIPLKIQADATKLYGINDSHVGTLLNYEFLNLFNLILSKQHQSD
jgi:pimeloyl-ACP methyl ester carboxylesterase